MKFGLFAFLPGERIRFDGPVTEAECWWQAIEQACVGEELGFESCWVAEHHFLTEVSTASAPEVFLSAVAQNTTTMRIGHGIRQVPPPYTHPARQAEMAAAVDIVSHGRLEFGVGKSNTATEIGGFQFNPSDCNPMLEEVFPEIVKMWTTNPYPGFEGKYFSMPAREVLPKPVQQPHPPLWMAVTSHEGFVQAGEMGVGIIWLGSGLTGGDPSETAALIREYKERVKKPTRQVGEVINDQVAAVQYMFCSEDQDEALKMGASVTDWHAASMVDAFVGMAREPNPEVWLANLARRGVTMTLEDIERLGTDKDYLQQTHDRAAKAIGSSGNEVSLVGTPEHVAKAVEFYESTGADHVLCIQEVGDAPHEKILDSMRLFATEVMPRFRDAPVSVSS